MPTRAMVRAASTAITGVAGSRYWKPLTGHSVKNATGTTSQVSSSRSRQVLCPRNNTRPAAASSSTSQPITGGNTSA